MRATAPRATAPGITALRAALAVVLLLTGVSAMRGGDIAVAEVQREL